MQSGPNCCLVTTVTNAVNWFSSCCTIYADQKSRKRLCAKLLISGQNANTQNHNTENALPNSKTPTPKHKNQRHFIPQAFCLCHNDQIPQLLAFLLLCTRFSICEGCFASNSSRGASPMILLIDISISCLYRHDIAINTANAFPSTVSMLLMSAIRSMEQEDPLKIFRPIDRNCGCDFQVTIFLL